MDDNDDTKTDLAVIREALSLTDLMILMDNGLELKYNVNYGVSNNIKFMASQQLSLGQHAVALLLIILNASQKLEDNRPLIMDQPEDDLDNSYIYETLVKDFRNSKRRRQMIISTHNPNIPVVADAENIIVLKYNGEHGYIDHNGAIDKPQICKSVLGILEGGHIALKKRKNKYEEIIHE